MQFSGLICRLLRLCRSGCSLFVPHLCCSRCIGKTGLRDRCLSWETPVGTIFKRTSWLLRLSENSKLIWNRALLSNVCTYTYAPMVAGAWSRNWSSLRVHIPYAIKVLLLSTWIFGVPFNIVSSITCRAGKQTECNRSCIPYRKWKKIYQVCLQYNWWLKSGTTWWF